MNPESRSVLQAMVETVLRALVRDAPGSYRVERLERETLARFAGRGPLRDDRAGRALVRRGLLGLLCDDALQVRDGCIFPGRSSRRGDDDRSDGLAGRFAKLPGGSGPGSLGAAAALPRAEPDDGPPSARRRSG